MSSQTKALQADTQEQAVLSESYHLAESLSQETALPCKGGTQLGNHWLQEFTFTAPF